MRLSVCASFNGLDGAWLDASTRRQWQTDFCREFDALRAQYLSP